MISETATQETQAGGRQRRWARGAARLAGVLAFLGVLGLLALLLATMAAPRLWGYHTYVIYGSSMEPTIKVGSLILAEPAPTDDLQVGDIIVYRGSGNGTMLTHRIVEIREGDGQRHFLTKGDASNGADPIEVNLEDGAQKMAHHVPYLGYIVDFAKGPLGIILLVVLPAIGLLALHLTNSRERAGQDWEAAGEAKP